MYFQTDCDRYVLNPSYSDPDGSYETHDDEIKVLVTNKRHLSRFLDRCFTLYTADFLKKIGVFNQYLVTPKGPIKLFNETPVDDAPPFETVIFSMLVDNRELVNRDYRSKMLSHWVLGAEHPTKFLKILSADFDIFDEGGLKRIFRKPAPKSLDKETDEAHCKASN